MAESGAREPGALGAGFDEHVTKPADIDRLNSAHATHLPARGGAAAACVGALLAMLRLVFAALLGAHVAHERAGLADGAGGLAPAAHHSRRQPAQLGTVHIERNAARHHLHVLLLQAGGEARVTGGGAVVTGFDTRLKLLLLHDQLLER
jgi:hypothetical protein